MDAKPFKLMSFEEIEEHLDTINTFIVPLYRRRIFHAGYEAFHDNIPISSCGYSVHSPAYAIWLAGWVYAYKTFLLNIGAIEERNGEKDKETTTGDSDQASSPSV